MGRGTRIAACLFVSLLCGAIAFAQATEDPHKLVEGLNAIRLDTSRVFPVRDLSLRRDAISLFFDEGKIAFLTAYEGRITGAVFTGHGRALALPRDPVEKGQLAHFLGAPLLDQAFTAVYLRFTDDTAAELERLMGGAGAQSQPDAAMADKWNDTIANLNPSQSLRILADWLAAEPQPYFYAGIVGENTGPFDVLVDDRRPEQVLIGQPRLAGGSAMYDIWASFRRSGEEGEYVAPLVVDSYSIETTIHADLSLDGAALLDLRAVRAGERVLILELSQSMNVETVTDAEGHAVAFFRSTMLTHHEAARRGNETLAVVLPVAPAKGAKTRLRFTYRGSQTISDAGNGVYFVGDRGSWYPHVSGMGQCAMFDLTFHWPQKLQLVATGKQIEQHDEGDQRTGHWKSEVPIPVAGFNLGQYVISSTDAGLVKVDVYANKRAEQSITDRVRRTAIQTPVPLMPSIENRTGLSSATILLPNPPPNPADSVKELGAALADAVRFYERLNGPLPYDHIAVSQISGTFGQGWPGLVYLSTFSFLSPAAQQSVGINERMQEHFTDIVPFHEMAHQWWGNLVVYDNYRDQWIMEGIANYEALMFAESRKPQEHPMTNWLDRYRSDLNRKEQDRETTVDEAGPISLGHRLRSSRDPNGYARVVYEKGTWIFQMLRMMLRDPAAKNPDERFARMLRTLLDTHRFKAVTTDDLQHAVEAVMTPQMALEGSRSMDWFFDQWVRGTGIPHYAVEFTVKPLAQGTGYTVRGTLKQSGVADTFLANVPLYATHSGGKPTLLGTLTANGPETQFHFTTPLAPKRIVVDAQQTLLCVSQ